MPALGELVRGDFVHVSPFPERAGAAEPASAWCSIHHVRDTPVIFLALCSAAPVECGGFTSNEREGLFWRGRYRISGSFAAVDHVASALPRRRSSSSNCSRNDPETILKAAQPRVPLRPASQT